MRACAAASVGLYLFVSGCASSPLNYSTLDLATCVGGIQTQQVLYNLSLTPARPSLIRSCFLMHSVSALSRSNSSSLAAPACSRRPGWPKLDSMKFFGASSIAARSASRTEHIGGMKTSHPKNMKSVEFWSARDSIDHEHVIERIS